MLECLNHRHGGDVWIPPKSLGAPCLGFSALLLGKGIIWGGPCCWGMLCVLGNALNPMGCGDLGREKPAFKRNPALGLAALAACGFPALPKRDSMSRSVCPGGNTGQGRLCRNPAPSGGWWGRRRRNSHHPKPAPGGKRGGKRRNSPTKLL